MTGRQNLNFFSAISGINKSIFLYKIDELTDLFECKDILIYLSLNIHLVKCKLSALLDV